MDIKRSGHQLEQAIAAGNFENAPALVEDYGAAIRRKIESAPAEQRSALAEQARVFLEERLHLARVMRAHIAADLHQVSGLASYQELPAAASSWQIDG